MKNIIIWFLAGWILASLFSCQTQKQWTKKGVQKGWIKESTDTLTVEVPGDTIVRDSLITIFADTIEKIIMQDCPDMKPEAKAKIKAYTKKKIPSYLQQVYKDSLAKFDNAGNLHVKAPYQKQTISPCEDKFWPDFAIGFMGGSLFMLLSLVGIAFYLGRSKKG